MKELMRNPDTFYKILELTVSTLNLEDMITHVVEELRELFTCERCTLFVADRKTNEVYTLIAQKSATGNFRLPLDKTNLAGFIVLTGRELTINNVYDDNELKKIDKDLTFCKDIDIICSYKTKNMISVPLKVKGEIIGVFQAINKPGGFLKRDMDAMREFSMILGLALNNALIVKDLMECRGNNRPVSGGKSWNGR